QRCDQRRGPGTCAREEKEGQGEAVASLPARRAHCIGGGYSACQLDPSCPACRFSGSRKVLWPTCPPSVEKRLAGRARIGPLGGRIFDPSSLPGADGAANHPSCISLHPSGMKSLASPPPELLVIDSDPLTLMGTAAVLDLAGYVCHCAP